MSTFLRPNPRPMPVVMSTVVLLLFYWGLYRMPLPGGGAAGPDAEQLRRLKESSDVLMRFKQWERALRPTLQLHRSFPDNPIYLAQLGEIYDRLGRYAEEAAIWELYLDRSPTPIEGCPQIGQAYEKLGLTAKAIAALERCFSFDRGNGDSAFYLARALERDRQLERASDVYRQGAALHPGYADLAIGSARMSLRLGRPREALEVSSSVVERESGNVDALLVLGLSSRQLGDRAAAREYLRRGAALAEGYADFHLALAQIAEDDADLDGAILHYQKVADLDHSNRAAADRLAVLRRAR